MKVTYFDNRNCDSSGVKEKNIDSCQKDAAWWLEAIRFAENVEKTTVIADFVMVCSLLLIAKCSLELTLKI